MNKNNCQTCGCELSNASFAEDGILCLWCGTINKIEGDPMPQPDDFGPDPEERSLSTDHLEEQASARYEDRYGSWDDYDGPDDDDGWDD